MFNTDNIFDTLHGGKVNGFDIMLMESDEKRQKLENAFEQAIKAGHNPNNIQDYIYDKLGFGPNDLIESDKILLKTKVEELYKRYGN